MKGLKRKIEWTQKEQKCADVSNLLCVPLLLQRNKFNEYVCFLFIIIIVRKHFDDVEK